jgi:uncharacterized repeat protein (TIGR03803 family)
VPLTQSANGTLWGTTAQGGPMPNNTIGSGTVFKLTTDGSLTTLYKFGTNPQDGAAPTAGLLLGK